MQCLHFTESIIINLDLYCSFSLIEIKTIYKKSKILGPTSQSASPIFMLMSL